MYSLLFHFLLILFNPIRNSIVHGDAGLSTFHGTQDNSLNTQFYNNLIDAILNFLSSRTVVFLKLLGKLHKLIRGN